MYSNHAQIRCRVLEYEQVIRGTCTKRWVGTVLYFPIRMIQMEILELNQEYSTMNVLVVTENSSARPQKL